MRGAWAAAALAVTGLLVACAGAALVAPPVVNNSMVPASASPALPPPAREFRGAWVATVANIDWPSAPGLSNAALRAEALLILDRARSIGLNALLLQVRPAGDALYPSTLEPWSEVLSGTQGKAPGAPGEAAFDPLAFWVDEAHKRGLELHAWFNPYRARHSAAKSPLAAPHIGVRRPELVKTYGDQLWMDPGEPAAAAHTLAVIADVAKRYDIDGVHIDDYFYPYPVTTAPAANAPSPANATPAVANDVPFPDDDSYARYRLNGGALARDDWRRSNVDTLVQAMHRLVHEVKPTLRFGISPFGVGKPELRPPGVIGFSQYDKLYADVERWLQNGWLDYLAPQLYWQTNREGLQFPVLLDYWLNQNAQSPQQRHEPRHVWPGLFTSQLRSPSNPQWPVRELLDQVELQRSRPQSSGHIHFSMIALMQDRDGFATLLQLGPYAQPALVPASPWLDNKAVSAPTLKRHGKQVQISAAAGEPAVRWLVWRRSGAAWRISVQGASERVVELQGADAIAVAAVNRVGLLSAPTIINTP